MPTATSDAIRPALSAERLLRRDHIVFWSTQGRQRRPGGVVGHGRPPSQQHRRATVRS